MKKVRCIFKNIDENYQAKFKSAECLLLISVGQESHEAERFEST